MYSAEMAEHANGAAQFLGSLFGGQYVTKDQTREAMDYLLARTKRNIESCHYASQEEKDAEIHRREVLMNLFKLLLGLIGKKAFANCTRLRIIEFNGPAPCIAYDAFYGCNCLEKVIVPSICYEEYKQYFNEKKLFRVL